MSTQDNIKIKQCYNRKPAEILENQTSAITGVISGISLMLSVEVNKYSICAIIGVSSGAITEEKKKKAGPSIK